MSGKPKPLSIPTPKPTLAQRSYLAGVIDCSGYFSARTDESGARTRLRFAVVSASREVLDHLAELYGGRVLVDATVCRWEIYSQNHISAIIDFVDTLVRSARIREQIDLIVSAMER